MSYEDYKKYENIVIPYIKYDEYPYAWYPFKESVSVINGIDINDMFMINKELYDMFDWEVYDYTLSCLIEKNMCSGMGTNLLQIPEDLIDHWGVYRIKFDGSYNIHSASIVFSFPYLNFRDVQEVLEQKKNDIWKMYWINPRYFQYRSIVPCLCFIFNSFEGETTLLEINSFFIEKYGEPVFYRHRKPTADEIKEYNDRLLECIE